MNTAMSTDKYVSDLMRALRMRNVESERIGDVVAEIRSHVAETGEDPREAFGSPRDYAEVVAGRSSPWTDRTTWLAVVLGGLTGWILAQTVFSVVEDRERLYGMPLWAAGLLAVLLIGLTAIAAARTYRPVHDPRSGRRILSGGGWPTVGVLVLLVALTVLVAIVTSTYA